MFNNLKINQRLALGFGAVLALLCLMTVVALVQLGRLNSKIVDYADNYVPSFQTQKDILASLAESRRSEYRHLTTDKAESQTRMEGEIDAARKAVQDGLEGYAKGPISDATDEKLLKEARAAVAAYDAQWPALRTLSRNLDDPERMAKGRAHMLGESTRAYKGALDAVNRWWDYNVKLTTDAKAESLATYNQARQLLGGAAIAALLLGIFGALRISRSITTPIQRAVEVAATVASGDLSSTIDTRGSDETAQLMQALQRMQTQLVEVVSNVRQNSESVATASSQIAQGNADLSSRTEEQASALQQTAATMEELGSTVRNNADSARQANQLAQGASHIATRGGEVVGRVVNTMQGISSSSRQIGDIISVIDGIAFQTNILALNAAVEAARAGEQGRGFAVVASEVRTLAQRSAEAAKEIKTLISRSVEQVEQGTELVDQAGKTMNEIVGSIQRVADIVAEIASASQEQSSGVQQVGDAVTQMDQNTQRNAALVEQSAAAAQSLQAQAVQLVQAVAVFKF